VQHARCTLAATAALIGLLAAAAPALGGEAARGAPQGDFARETIINGPTDVVWRLLTTERGLESWLAPQADVDLRIGGLVRTHQDARGRIGDPQTLVNRVLAVEPGRRVTLQVDKTPDGYPWAGAVIGTRYDVTVDPLKRGRTRVRCVAYGFPGGPMGYALRSLLDRGAVLALDQLRKAAETQKPRRG